MMEREREMIINILNRVGADWHWCDDNTIMIVQGTCEATCMGFDENGIVTFFE